MRRAADLAVAVVAVALVSLGIVNVPAYAAQADGPVVAEIQSASVTTHPKARRGYYLREEEMVTILEKDGWTYRADFTQVITVFPNDYGPGTIPVFVTFEFRTAEGTGIRLVVPEGYFRDAYEAEKAFSEGLL